LSTLRPPEGFPKDIDIDELIIENLKMEIHMSVFHSAESLFYTVLGHKIHPELPWFWMTVTGQGKFNNIMNIWQESGLEAIIKEPEIWLRNALYPTVDKSHKDYDRSKRSVIFAKDYLDRLARNT
jgi:hypothetical protein